MMQDGVITKDVSRNWRSATKTGGESAVTRADLAGGAT